MISWSMENRECIKSKKLKLNSMESGLRWEGNGVLQIEFPLKGTKATWYSITFLKQMRVSMIFTHGSTYSERTSFNEEKTFIGFIFWQQYNRNNRRRFSSLGKT